MSGVFFFNDTATTEIYTLSLHDALPISRDLPRQPDLRLAPLRRGLARAGQLLDLLAGQPGEELQVLVHVPVRSEEHTSELQSRQYLVCRLLLEKKNHHCSFVPTSHPHYL